MENVIIPEVLKDLMAKRKLTQQALAELTVANRSPVGLATIKRICSSKGGPLQQRKRTIDALAKALKVKCEDLTGSAPGEAKDELLRAYVTVKCQVTRDVDLAFQAVESIYGISRTAQIAMAPLFAALMAESSLTWRRQRLEKMRAIADDLNAIRGDDPLLAGAFSRTWEAENVEDRSIGRKDVLGHDVLREQAELYDDIEIGSISIFDVTDLVPSEWPSPFCTFLKEMAGSFKSTQIEITSGRFDESNRMSDGTLDYRIGERLISDICAGSIWARRALESGAIALKDIPRELMAKERIKERVAFLESLVSAEDRIEMASAWKNEFELFEGAKSDQSQAVGEDRVELNSEQTKEGDAQ